MGVMQIHVALPELGDDRAYALLCNLSQYEASADGA